MAANTASAVLVSSNPTNILITGSFSLNYLTQFTKWTVLPSIIPALVNYPILLFMFRKDVPKKIVPLKEDPRSKLRDPRGAIFFSCLMLVTLAVLVGTTFVPGGAVQVWMVTAPAGIMAFLFDVGTDVWKPEMQRMISRRRSEVPATELQSMPTETVSADPSKTVEKDSDELTKAQQKTSPPRPSSKSPQARERHRTVSSFLRYLAHRFPGSTRTITRLPIALLPFAMCEFIMVRGLAQRGWIHVFASGFANACTTPAKTVFLLGFVCAAFLCPLAGTNIGATIILVEILRDPAFAQSAAVQADNRVLLGAIYAVALGSNLGAFSYTFAGSLAGLLWRALLKDKGVHISQLKFALVNAIPLVVQTTLACAIIIGQLYWFE